MRQTQGGRHDSRMSIRSPTSNDTPLCYANNSFVAAEDDAEGERGRGKLLPPLSLPKNRSTGNLAGSADTLDRSRYRMSFEGSSSGLMDYDPLAMYVSIFPVSFWSGFQLFLFFVVFSKCHARWLPRHHAAFR